MLADYRHRAAHAGGKGIQRYEGEGADVMRYVEQFASDWAVIISGQRKIEWLNFGSLFGVVGAGVVMFVISLRMADSFIHCGLTQDFPELQ